MAIHEVESSKPKKAQKVLRHIEIHPQLGGGHVVRHVYHDYQSRDVKFNKDGKSQGGEHVQAHLTKHAGLPAYDSGGGGSETEEEIQA